MTELKLKINDAGRNNKTVNFGVNADDNCTNPSCNTPEINRI